MNKSAAVITWGLCLLAADLAAAQEILPSAAVRYARRGATPTPDFQKHVSPLLGRLGCNTAKCHGSFQGRGEFRLSLFGYDFASDHAALQAEASSAAGSRLDVGQADRSLIIRKPTEQVDHEGGRRLEPGSWEHHLLVRWIETGAKGPRTAAAAKLSPAATDQALVELQSEPAELVFRETGGTARLRVIAVWQDGSREDVTCLARFRSNDDAVVAVDRDGRATSSGPGDTHIIAFYDNGVAAIPVLRPYGPAALTERTASPPPNRIDQFIGEKLTKLQLAPSELCSDAEFLRRVSIDMTGTLPAPLEIVAFLADEAVDKRLRKIDELLERTTYAAWWSNKLCEFTGCNPASIRSLLEVAQEEGYVKALQWYDWTYERVAANQPYDELVAGMMLADLSAPAGEGMPHFWTRQSLEQPQDTAMSVAHSFLGIQLQCAECHKHPFDRWTQRDFQDFAQFFESVTPRKQAAPPRGGRQLWLLRSRLVALDAGDDPRRPIMEWMREPDNPWFARAFVNRVWAGYFHVGIVEPPDQFTPANPPSHPRLLDWLTRDFIDNGYDMKRLHRQIAGSDAYQRSWRPNATNRDDRRNFSRAVPRRIPAEVVYDALKQATAATDKQDVVRTDLRRRASGRLSMRMSGTHAMRVFGKPDRASNCDCERIKDATLLHAIFLQNDPLVRMRLAESGWIAEIEDAEAAGRSLDPSQLAVQIWLRTVNRPPTAAETARAVAHLKSTASRSEGVRDLLWALLNTKEFLLNH